MTFPNNLALGINKDTEGDTVDFKILICIVFAVVLPVVLDACPLFVLNVLFYGYFVLVSAQSDDPNVFPFCVFGVLFKHKLVVSHYRWQGGHQVAQKSRRITEPGLCFTAVVAAPLR